MTCFICATCGTQFADSPRPPAACPICEDERQYVGWAGQAWTTHDELAARHHLRLEEDAGLFAIGLGPDFAINQRALHVRSPGANVLWESLSIVTPEAVAALQARGGISHPHFYASMVAWSEALGGVPILLHEADRDWVQRPSAHIEFWRGDTLALSPDLTLYRCGGHFAGSTALHWRQGAHGGGALLPGDALQVVNDRRHVSFMYSYPNLIPMKRADVEHIRTLLADVAFEDVYGFTWGRNIVGGGRAAVDASFERYLRTLQP
jgi:hypothetical protein